MKSNNKLQENIYLMKSLGRPELQKLGRVLNSMSKFSLSGNLKIYI